MKIVTCYIGQTRINIGIRLKENIRNIKNQETDKSPIAERVLDTNHRIEKNNTFETSHQEQRIKY